MLTMSQRCSAALPCAKAAVGPLRAVRAPSAPAALNMCRRLSPASSIPQPPARRSSCPRGTGALAVLSCSLGLVEPAYAAAASSVDTQSGKFARNHGRMMVARHPPLIAHAALARKQGPERLGRAKFSVGARVAASSRSFATSRQLVVQVNCGSRSHRRRPPRRRRVSRTMRNQPQPADPGPRRPT